MCVCKNIFLNIFLTQSYFQDLCDLWLRMREDFTETDIVSHYFDCSTHTHTHTHRHIYTSLTHTLTHTNTRHDMNISEQNLWSFAPQPFYLTLLWLGFSVNVKGLGGGGVKLPSSKILVKRSTGPFFCMVIEDHK